MSELAGSHATLEAFVRSTAAASNDPIGLRSPAPGWFRPLHLAPVLIGPGDPIGTLDVLGRAIRIVMPPVSGVLLPIVELRAARIAVDHGTLIARVDQSSATLRVTARPAETGADQAARPLTTGLVFAAPTSGRFYGRPAPDKPPFVATGAELRSGTTICLLEVMKTFHRVSYGGAGLPERARVSAVLVADGTDVNAGDPLLSLEPLGSA